MKKNILLICVIFMFFSCEKEKKTEILTEPTSSTSNEILISEAVVIIDTVYSESNTIEDYCIALENLKSEYLKKLNENNSKERNNELYENYKSIRNAHIKNLNFSNGDILDKFVDYYNEDVEDFVLPNDVKNIENQLKAVEIEFWYIGEGYTEMRNIPQHFLTLFKGKVTPDYEDYIKQIAHQNKELYSADAGLVAPFSEVADRVIFWENFLNNYSKSKLFQKAKMHYNNYLHDFIFGLDNTPTIEDSQIYPVFGEVHTEFIKKYPNSLATKKIKELPKLVVNNFSYEEIHEKLKLEDRIWEDE